MASIPTDRELITVSQAADVLGIGRSTAYKLVRRWRETDGPWARAVLDGRIDDLTAPITHEEATVRDEAWRDVLSAALGNARTARDAGKRTPMWTIDATECFPSYHTRGRDPFDPMTEDEA